MTVSSSIASPRRLRDGFTPLPVEICPSTDFCGAGRGLSIQQPRQHQREIPVGQGFERRGVAQYMAHIGQTTVMEQVIAERAAA